MKMRTLKEIERHFTNVKRYRSELIKLQEERESISWWKIWRHHRLVEMFDDIKKLKIKYDIEWWHDE